MPDKITSKNLTYDSTLPPFLAALRGQAVGSQGPDPILSGRRRGAKKRSGSEEAEDAPLVLDDDGNAVAVEFEKDGTVRERLDAQKYAKEDTYGSSDQPEGKDKASNRETESKTSFGARKRKIAKVVGDTALDADEKGNAKKPQDEQAASTAGADKKVKKKAKKIKLSFDED